MLSNWWLGRRKFHIEMMDLIVGWLSRFQELCYYFYSLCSYLRFIISSAKVNFFSELDNIDLYQWAMIKEFDGRVLNIWVGSKNLDVEMLDPPVGWLSRFQERRYSFYHLYSSS